MLGKLEEFVLMALKARGPDAMAAAVYEAIEDQLGEKASFGAVFTTLDRLVDKKFVNFKVHGPSPATKNRSRKVYTISALGQETLEESLEKTQSFMRLIGFGMGA